MSTAPLGTAVNTVYFVDAKLNKLDPSTNVFLKTAADKITLTFASSILGLTAA